MRSPDLPVERGAAAARPFVKWAGGKAGLLEQIIARLPAPASMRRYVEPFVGGGAVFFGLRALFPDCPMRIADNNPALIGAYIAIRDRVEDVVKALARHARRHGPEHYYRVRRSAPNDPAAQAARLIYLNRTCYNGLWRVNRKGRFNVPMGRYRKPRILDEQNLRRVSLALGGVEILCADFEEAVSDCRAGDVVYFDPPYDPLSLTSNFTAYTPSGFGPDGQRRLASIFEELAGRGVHVLASNSDTAFIRRLYRGLSPAPSIDRVWVPRSINSKAEGRRAIAEVLIWHRADGGPVTRTGVGQGRVGRRRHARRAPRRVSGAPG